MNLPRSLFACVAVLAYAGAAQASDAVMQRGTASFYADSLHGRRTASGEIMDQNAFTAASRTLPLGTHAVVTNLKTGKSVRVRINDRGPNARGRVIDLSKRAAAALGLDRYDGVVKVSVEARPSEQPTAALKEKIAAAARDR